MHPPTLLDRAGARRGAALVKLLLVALLAVAVALVLLDRAAASKRELFVVNGYGAPLSVELEGLAPIQLAPGARAPLVLAEGRWRLRASGAAALDEEFTLDGAFGARLLDRRVHVLNPGGAGILLRETTSYLGSALEQAAAPELTLAFGETLSSFEPVDHLFEPFPERIEGAAGAAGGERSRLDLFSGDPAALVARLVSLGRGDEALRLAEWALGDAPGAAPAMLAAYTAAAKSAGALERARAFLRPRLVRRPVEVDVHREYQKLAGDERELAQLVAEYDALVAAEPASAELAYLRGRLEARCEEAGRWFQRASELDPQSPWAWFSLATSRAAAADWAGAAEAARRACASPEGAARFRGFLDLARFSAGERATLEAELDARRSAQPADLASWVMLALVRVAAGRTEAADALPRELGAALDALGAPAADVQALVQSLQLDLLQARGELEAALPLAVDPARRGRLLLELGQLDEAEELLRFEEDAFLELGFASARALAGDAQAARRWRERAAARLAQGDPPSRLVARALDGAEGGLEPALDVFLRPDQKALALVALAELHPERAAELRQRALALHRVPSFPRGLLERAAAGR